MLQETPRKYTKLAYSKGDLGTDQELDGNNDVEEDIRTLGIVNW
jgi:hypothetical protein